MIAGVSDLRMERDPLGGGTALFSAPVLVGEETRSLYRYVLERQLQPRPEVRRPGWRLVACGLNPSTADAFKLDPTTKREVAWALEWGCETYVKVNAEAWRDTHPANVRRARRAGADTIGPSNDLAIHMALTQLKRDGGIALASWGVGVTPARQLALIRIAHDLGVTWQCAGINDDGSPVHPLIRRKLTAGDDRAPVLRDWLGPA